MLEISPTFLGSIFLMARSASTFGIVAVWLVSATACLSADEAQPDSQEQPGEIGIDPGALTRASVTCPGYGACTNWSATYACGEEFCGFVGPCKFDGYIGLRQPREKYRVCFDQWGDYCTEYQDAGSSFIGGTCGC
jgi:hypothetical protein